MSLLTTIAVTTVIITFAIYLTMGSIFMVLSYKEIIVGEFYMKIFLLNFIVLVAAMCVCMVISVQTA